MTNEADQKKGEEAKKEKPGSSALTKKVIRIVTVMAYCSGISGAGVLLSLYYIFFWDPQITGVRPPGYLRSGDRIGVGMPEARMAPLPEAFSGNQPIAHPHKMSKEFMEAYLANLTKDEVGPQNDLMAAQPTPKVMSVVRVGSEGAEPHYNPDPTPVTEGGGDVTSPRPFLYVSTTAPAGEAPAAAAAPSTEASPARGGATDICLKRTSALLETSCPALEDI